MQFTLSLFRLISTMVSFTILAGGYDVFVAAYLFASDPGSLTVTSTSPTGDNPSWITLHPTNSSVLYAVNELTDGAVQSFIVSSDGVLSSPIDTVASGGDSPAFTVALTTGQVAVPNYNGATLRVIPTYDAVEFDNLTGTLAFPPPAGGASHPHMVVQHGKELLVPDLGGDKIWRVTEDGSSGVWNITGLIEQPAGSGPRHIVIYDGYLYTIHELASTLTVQLVPPAPNGTTDILADVSIIPADPPANASYAAAEILIPEPTDKFPIPYIYVSNRNTGTQDVAGDSIAIFEHINKGLPNESLQLIRQVFTGLDQIRGMQIGEACPGGEEYLVAAGVAGTAGTVVYRRVDEGRNLTEVARNTDIPTRSSFVWLC